MACDDATYGVAGLCLERLRVLMECWVGLDFCVNEGLDRKPFQALQTQCNQLLIADRLENLNY